MLSVSFNYPAVTIIYEKVVSTIAAIHVSSQNNEHSMYMTYFILNGTSIRQLLLNSHVAFTRAAEQKLTLFHP